MNEAKLNFDSSVYVTNQFYDSITFAIRFLDHVLLRIERVYLRIPRGKALIAKCSWPSYLRNGIEAKAFRACRGDFGTPTLYASYEPFTPNHHCITNVFLLPDDETENCGSFHWQFAKGDKYNMATEPDYRNLVVTLFQDEGRTLEYCKSAWELCLCLLHAMLGTLSQCVAFLPSLTWSARRMDRNVLKRIHAARCQHWELALAEIRYRHAAVFNPENDRCAGRLPRRFEGQRPNRG